MARLKDFRKLLRVTGHNILNHALQLMYYCTDLITVTGSAHCFYEYTCVAISKIDP